MLKVGDVGRIGELYADNNYRCGFYVHNIDWVPGQGALVITFNREKDVFVLNVYRDAVLVKKGLLVKDEGIWQVTRIYEKWDRQAQEVGTSPEFAP